MPRTQGVSSSCTVWLIRRRPKPRMVSRCDCLVPIKLLICVTFMVLVFFLAFVMSYLTPKFLQRSCRAWQQFLTVNSLLSDRSAWHAPHCTGCSNRYTWPTHHAHRPPRTRRASRHRQ